MYDIHMCVYVCVYICMCVYIYIYIYTHTCIVKGICGLPRCLLYKSQTTKPM